MDRPICTGLRTPMHLRKVGRMIAPMMPVMTTAIAVMEVEITVRQVGLVVRAEETTTDMYASVDGAISSIERQIRKLVNWAFRC